jgi:dienelactone hydrolase
MRHFFAFLLLISLLALSSPSQATSAAPSAPIEVAASPHEGFHFGYFLVPPARRARGAVVLLVETNNTGQPSDDLKVHREAALASAKGRSVGGFVAKELDLPFLVPQFPRPADRPLLYTHALDRDAIEIKDGPLARLDRQLIAMIGHAQKRLRALGFTPTDKIFLNGFSASGTFANRFALLHPDRVKAVACGGINAMLTLPLRSVDGVRLPYPIGVADWEGIVGAPFASAGWVRVPQFLYMGADDTNDAVAFDDGYSARERATIHAVLGARMQPDRWQRVQALYKAAKANVTFRTYAGMGHGTNGAINREVAAFFRSHLE